MPERKGIHSKMFYRLQVKSIKLGLLSLIITGFLCYLGYWQLSRAIEKAALLETYAARKNHAPITANELKQNKDWRFYRTALTGTFDNQHTLLLDNKIFNGQVGYEIYTPFKAEGLNTIILVDRGFIPAGRTRSIIPAIKMVAEKTTITGMINTPPTYVKFGEITEGSAINWPLRIAYIYFPDLAKLIKNDLSSNIVVLTPNDPAAYPLEWQIVIMPPERHRGYALQWFALAITLLILSLALNCRIRRIDD